MTFWKRTFPLMIAFTMGVTMALQYYIPHQRSSDLLENVTKWGRIIAGFSVFIGAYSLLHLHTTRIKRKAAGWGYSAFIFIGAGPMLLWGIYNGGKWFWDGKQSGTAFDWIYYNIQVPGDATVFSLLAFFIASAAYRTFRARTFGATILLLAAIIVMLGRVPIGAAVSSYFADLASLPESLRAWASLPAWAAWIMDVPNLAAKRGILLGVSLGAIATSLKIIFGIERTYLGGGE